MTVPYGLWRGELKVAYLRFDDYGERLEASIPPFTAIYLQVCRAPIIEDESYVFPRATKPRVINETT